MTGEFHGSVDKSTQGPLGDIRGRPDDADLALVTHQVLEMVLRFKDKDKPEE